MSPISDAATGLETETTPGRLGAGCAVFGGEAEKIKEKTKNGR